MSITEVLLELISPMLARMLLIRWIGNGDIAEELTGSLREIVSKFTKDLRAQRKAERLFTDIGEEVAEGLYRVFEIEGVNIEDSRKHFIAKAVGETLPHNISTDTALSKILLSHNLDAQKLSRYLQKSFPHRQELDPPEELLYQRIITEACYRIIHISSDLPGFNAIVLSELLRRSQGLTDTAHATLDKVNHLYEDAFSSRRNQVLQTRQFEHDYRQAVVWVLDNVELFGLNVRASIRRQPLSIAYVTLGVSDQDNEGDIYSAPVALAGSRRILISGEAGSGKTTLLKWIAVRSANNDFEQYAKIMSNWGGSIPFFIRLRDFAREDQHLPSPENWISLVAPEIAALAPDGWVQELLKKGQATVLIDGLDEVPGTRQYQVQKWLLGLLRTYKKARFIVSSRPEALKDLETTWGEEFHLNATTIQSIVQSWSLKEESLRFELPSVQTKNLVELAHRLKQDLESELKFEWESLLDLSEFPIDQFIQEINVILDHNDLIYRQSREKSKKNIKTIQDSQLEKLLKSLAKDWEIQAKKELYRKLNVQRMTDETIGVFVANWHIAVVVNEGDLPGERAKLTKVAENLISEFYEHKPLRLLATNPLLCAMLCALHRDREQDLPRDRIKLYETCLDILIKKRDEYRGVSRTDYPNLSKQQIYHLLQDLAYWMMRNDYTAAAPRLEVEKRLNLSIGRMVGSEKPHGSEILRLFVERTGLVREPSPEIIDFAHRTFQEFLAAKAITSEGDVHSLSSYFSNPEWQEVVILSSSLVDKQDLAWILNELLTKKSLLSLWPKVSEQEQRRLSMMALNCLIMEPVISDEAKITISKHLEVASPPQSKYEVYTFIYAGELAVPFLSYKSSYGDAEVANCIETLILIGGEKSLQQLTQTVKSIDSWFTRGKPKSRVGRSFRDMVLGNRAKFLKVGWWEAVDTIRGNSLNLSSYFEAAVNTNKTRSKILKLKESNLEENQLNEIPDTENFRVNQATRIAYLLYQSWSIWEVSENYAKQILQPLVNKTNYLLLERVEYFELASRYLDLTSLEHLEIVDCRAMDDWEQIYMKIENLLYLHTLSFSQIVNLNNFETLAKKHTLQYLYTDIPEKIPNILKSKVKVISMDTT